MSELSTSPKVSILMNCYNGATYLEEALNSIKEQTYTNWEIVFIDNHSSDDSQSIAQSFDGPLTYLKTPKHVTLYEARRFALPYLTGDLIAFLDTDDRWFANKLEKQISVLKQFDVDFICSGARVLVEKDKSLHYTKVFKDGPTSFETMLKRYNVNIQTVLLKRACVGELNFDHRLNIAGDYLFFLQYLKKNPKAYFISAPLVDYRVHDSNISNDSLEVWEKEIDIIKSELAKICTQQQKSYYQVYWDKKIYRILFKTGHTKKARAVISPHKFFSWRELLMYTLAYFPHLKNLVVPSWWQ